MKFENEIEIESRISGTIKLKKLTEQTGYFPGIYFTDYIYQHNYGERCDYFWIRIDNESPESLGTNKKDWIIIPDDIFEYLKNL